MPDAPAASASAAGSSGQHHHHHHQQLQQQQHVVEQQQQLQQQQEQQAVVELQQHAVEHAQQQEQHHQQPIWVFGYGSLSWRPGFEHAEAVEGCIKGWRRVWWQGSTDHRGTPERPGRTVTLAAAPGAVTWGVAYRLAGTPGQQAATLAYLEHREKQYDQRHTLPVFRAAGDESPAVAAAHVYVATSGPTNVNWMGPAPLPDIAAQVVRAVGPSGPNREYVFRLADAMRAMGLQQDDDPELFALEAEVRRLLLLEQGQQEQQEQEQPGQEQPEQQQEQEQAPSSPPAPAVLRTVAVPSS